MEQRSKVIVEDRVALQRERRRLAEELYQKGLITREAFDREVESGALERPREKAAQA
jgi:hypothetical protein